MIVVPFFLVHLLRSFVTLDSSTSDTLSNMSPEAFELCVEHHVKQLLLEFISSLLNHIANVLTVLTFVELQNAIVTIPSDGSIYHRLALLKCFPHYNLQWKGILLAHLLKINKLYVYYREPINQSQLTYGKQYRHRGGFRWKERK